MSLMTKLSRAFFLWALPFLATLLSSRALVAQCAMCGRSIAAGQGQGADLPAAFYWGAIFMLGMMVLLVGGLIGLIVQGARQSPSELELEAAAARHELP
jgi:hypothetical protein